MGIGVGVWIGAGVLVGVGVVVCRLILSRRRCDRMLELTMAEKRIRRRHRGQIGMIRRNRKSRGWSSCDVAVVVQVRLAGITILTGDAILNPRVIPAPYPRRTGRIGTVAVIAGHLIPGLIPGLIPALGWGERVALADQAGKFRERVRRRPAPIRHRPIGRARFGHARFEQA